MINQIFFDGKGAGPDHGAERCRQVVEITQIVKQEVTQVEGGGEDKEENSAKKRKLEMNFQSSVLDSVRKSLAQTGEEDSAIPWLQILTRFAILFPSTLVTAGLMPKIVQVLMESLEDCRSSATKIVLLRAWHAVIGVVDTHQMDLFSGRQRVILVQLWDYTVNTVSLNHCVAEGNALLQALIKHRARQEEAGEEALRKLYFLLTSKLVKANIHSLQTYITLVAHCPRLPEIKAKEVPSHSSLSQR